MIGKNYSYRGLNLSDSNVYTNLTVLQDVLNGVDVSFKKFENANFHGTYWEKLLMQGRTFAFSGLIHGITKELRGTRKANLVKYVIPEYDNTENLYYDLFWQTDDGEYRTAKVMVADYPKFKNALNSPDIEFEFLLYSGRPEVWGVDWQTVVGGIGVFGGELEGEVLAHEYNEFSGTIEVEHAGNWTATCRVTLESPVALVNPKFFNLTTDTEFKIDGDYDYLIIDTLNLDNDPKEKLIVTSGGIDVLKHRITGAGMVLAPWTNHLVVLCDNYEEAIDAVVTIEYRDTFLE